MSHIENCRWRDDRAALIAALEHAEPYIRGQGSAGALAVVRATLDAVKGGAT